MPAVAFAATFTGRYPTGTVRTQPQFFAVTALGAVAFDTRTPQIRIDGTAYRTLINAGNSSGYWSATEVWDPVRGVWTVKWTWVKSAAAPYKATLYSYPVFSAPLADGPHTVSATVKDKLGAWSTENWTIDVQIPPTIGAPVPAAGSIVSTRTPAISVPVSDNGPGALTATATVNGAAATATVSGGAVSVASPRLPNDAVTTVTVTVTDAAGSSATRTWSFAVQIYPEMTSTVGFCEDCHPDAATDPDMADDCSICHAGQLDYPHQGAPATFHTRASGSSCSECHISDITVEHNRRGLTCLTCHNSTDPQVVAAIASGSTDCGSCHDLVDPHAGIDVSAVHTISTLSAAFTIQGVDLGTHQCADCHETNAAAQHENVCGTCHPTAAAAASPWDRTCASVGCHSPASSVPMHDAIDPAHDKPALTADCLGSGCHGAGAITPFVGRSIAEIHSAATTSVAGETRTSCTICHRDGWVPTNNCLTSGCHSDRANPHGYDSVRHTGTPASQTFSIGGATYPAVPCADCHSMELGVEHVKPSSTGNIGCTECHPTRVAQLPQPWNKSTCAQGGCHTPTSPAPMHGSIDTSHTRSLANSACFAAGCHTDGSLAAVHSNASTEVAGVPVASCLVCHAAGVPASGDCTTCHADKVASHYNALQHTAVTTGTVTILGVSHGTRTCTECHPSIELGVIHAAGCSTCHPTAAAAAKPWDGSCGTGGCHAVGSARPMHENIDSVHVRLDEPEAADGCFISGCHQGGASLAAIHAGKDDCATCHAPGKTPTANCNASGCHASLFSPHANQEALHTSPGDSDFVSVGMDNGDHVYGNGVSGACQDCHVVRLETLHLGYCGACHDSSAPEAVRNAVANHWTACTSCHPGQHDSGNAAHEDVYTRGCDCHDDPGGDLTLVSCTGCHAPWAPVPQPVTTSDARASYINDATINLFPTDSPYGLFGIRATYFILDGTPVATGTHIEVPAPGSGTQSHTLEFWSTDWSGNTEATNTVSFTVEHDSYPPVTTSDIVSGTTYAGDRTITLTPTDADSYVANTWWQLDSTSPEGWNSGTTIAVAEPLTGGASHTLYWYSRDGIGNTETVKSAAFTVVAGRDFEYTGADQTFVVPSGLTTVAITLAGGSGGNSVYVGGTYSVGGAAGRVVAIVPVTPGQTLTARVGRAGYPCNQFGSSGPGGWPNGGRGNTYGGGGGGSTSVWVGPSELLEAGGGGGAGGSSGGGGGAGGAQGTLPGGYRTGANAGNYGAGGGAGGWNAGAAGSTTYRGGAGGTSYIASGTGTLTGGAWSGNGYVTIRY